MQRNWTGFRGLEQEDAIMSMSMGPVLDRTQEHLVAADQAVVRLRRRVLDNIKVVEGGGDAIGAMTEDLTALVATDMNAPGRRGLAGPRAGQCRCGARAHEGTGVSVRGCRAPSDPRGAPGLVQDKPRP